MERLTMYRGICQMASTEYCLSKRNCYECGHGRKVFQRLATYEDLGRTPEEMAAYIAELERLRDIKTALENDVYNYEMNLSHITQELEALREAALWVSKEASNNA